MREQRWWVGLQAAPTGSALGGATAAELGGLRGFEDDRTWLVIPGSQRRLVRPGTVVLHSRVLGEADVHPTRVPRRTSVERSVLDMAGNAVGERGVRAPILAAVQQGITVPRRLRDALARRGRCRHRRLINETIDDAEGGIQSLPERGFDRIRRRRALPTPTRQRVMAGPNGRFYLDADWDEFALTAEIHGMGHLEVRSWDADLDRHNELSIDGRRLLQFSSFAIRHLPERVGDQLERGLARGGWRR